MKIGLIITNLAGGGAEKVMITLADKLLQRGHEVLLILLENYIEHQIPQGVTTFALTEKAPRGWLGKRLLARYLNKHLKQPLDLIISALPFANEVAILANLPNHWCRIDNALSVEIDQLINHNHLIKAWRRRRRYRRLYNQRPLIALTDDMVVDLRQQIGINSRIEKIPNPFDLAAIRQAAQAVIDNLPQRRYVIHVGRFNQQKRHDLLLAAWKNLATDHVLVLLTAPNAALQKMIDDYGQTERVIIAGFQTNPYPWIANAALLVLCSDHEGLPGVIIEALAVGTPVISTDCLSGPREILNNAPAGCLVPTGDVVALTQALRTALINPPDITQINLNRFASENVINLYEHLINKA